MREQPARANFRWRPHVPVTLALLACFGAMAPQTARCQAPIRFASPDPTAGAETSTTVTPPPTPSPSYSSAAQSGVASPSNATPFGPAPAATAAPTLPPAGYGSAPASGGAIYTPGPMATLNGSVQPPPATFDPYAPPGPLPAAAVPQDPYYNAQPSPPPTLFTLPPALAEGYRFIQEIGLDYHWFAGHGSTDQLGINDIDTWVTFALPMPLFSQQQPQQQGTPQQPPKESMLLISPGFAWHFWDGPASTPEDGFADMPARTYDAYLDARWNPVFMPGAFSAELEASIGVYSDFTTITSQSIRLKGKGVAVIGIPDTKLQMKLGVWYIDRGLYKLLPAGGFVWTPSPVTRFDILFPNPKFTQMLSTTQGGTEWWWYLAGEYGGGVWTIKRAEGPDVGHIDLVDYNDIRVALGVNFKCPRGQTGFFEGGYAFNRQLVYASGEPSTFAPNGTFYLHAGTAF